jgi:PAS domain S-box-containing protein
VSQTTPFADTPDPRGSAALRIARVLVAGTAGLGAIGAAFYLWVPSPMSDTARIVAVAGCLLFAVLCASLSRLLDERSLARIVQVVGAAIVGMVGVLCSANGQGIGSINVGYIVVAIFMVAVLAGKRQAWWLTAFGCVVAGALGAAEMVGWLPSAASQRPVGLRLFGLVLLLVAGGFVATSIASIVARQLLELDRRGEHFNALLRVAADWYWELDEQLRFTRYSEDVVGVSGLDAAGVLGEYPWDLPFGLDDDDLDAHRADLESRRPFYGLIARRTTADGARFVSISGEPRFDERGVFRGYWGVGHDVTDQFQVRQAREASETRYRELFDRSPSAYVLHRNGSVLDANPAALELFGYAADESMVGRNLLDHYHDPEARQRTIDRLAQMARLPVGAALPTVELTLVDKLGRRLAVRVSSVRVDAVDGAAALSMYEDMTERRAAENALRGSQALLSKVLTTTPDLVALTLLDSGRFVLVNEGFTRVLGYRSEELVGRTAIDLGTWKRPDERERLVAAVRRDGQVLNKRVEFVAKSGAIVDMLVSAAAFSSEGRSYLVVNGRDVSQTERMRLEREVMFDTASIGIAFTRNSVFVQANPRFEQMFGWREGSLAGQPGRVVWSSDEEYAEISRTLGPRLMQGQQVDIERLARRADGSEFWCRMLAKAVDPTRPGAGGTVWITDDITERRRTEHALAQARDAAEAASRAKSAFLANTSHELRTPLNGLLGLARLAQSPSLEPVRRQRYIDQIAESAQALSDIIADILDLSKIEAGKLSVEDVPFDPAATVRTLHRAYRELAQARGLSLTLDIAGDVPAMVRGDPVRTRQILSNYVANALKFTSEGRVHIELSVTAAGALRLAVLDTGPGIDAATRERLFSPFTQADDSTTRRYGGTGLGLSICRQLATLMGGRVGVDSELGRGSMFWAELPLPATDEDDAVSGFGGLDERALVGTHVLVVEDNAVNMMICVALLEQRGVRVAQAAHGREALDAVARATRDGDPFDAVLMDVQMPVMSGYEATRLLRERHDAQSLPIIALTAAALVSEREQALAAGMNDFLTKPIEPDRLLQALSRALQATTSP